MSISAHSVYSGSAAAIAAARSLASSESEQPTDAASEALSHKGFKSLEQLGTEAREYWSEQIANLVTEPAELEISGFELAIERSEAARLFATTDINNPTLQTNPNALFGKQTSVAVSPGEQQSALLAIGSGHHGNQLQVFVFVNYDGDQVAYLVENGELTTRIPDNETVGISLQVQISGSTGGRPVSIKYGDTTILFNDDLSQLSQIGKQLFFVPSINNVYDVETGLQLVSSGVPILDNMSDQQQFDYYSNTPEGQAILDFEGNWYNSDVELRLFVARVRLLRGEGEATDLFSEFTPRRESLSGADLATYDAQVLEVTEYLREIGVYSVGESFVGGSENPTQLDDSLLYMIATAIVESHGTSPTNMAIIMADVDTQWIVSIDNEDGIELIDTESAGWYDPGRGIIQLSIEDFVPDYANHSDDYDIVAHEVAHSIDIAGGSSEGIPPGLDGREVLIFLDERARLFNLAYPGQNIDMSVNQDHTTVVDSSGLSNYAFRNQLEFWAVISEAFLSSNQGAMQLLEASPELYDLLRDYYERDDLPTAEEAQLLDDLPSIIRPLLNLPSIDLPSTISPLVNVPLVDQLVYQLDSVRPNYETA